MSCAEVRSAASGRPAPTQPRLLSRTHAPRRARRWPLFPAQAAAPACLPPCQSLALPLCKQTQYTIPSEQDVLAVTCSTVHLWHSRLHVCHQHSHNVMMLLEILPRRWASPTSALKETISGLPQDAAKSSGIKDQCKTVSVLATWS